MKKKILYLITKATWGGAQRYVFDLATALPKDLFDIAVAFGQDGLLAKRLRHADVTTFPIDSMQRDVSLGADIKSFFEFYRLFKKEKPDVVHLNSSKAGGVGAFAARFAGIPKIIFTVHGWPFLERRNILSRAIILLASWFTAQLCHKIIVVSEYDLEIARKMPFISHKTIRIYNGIDLHMQFGSADVIRHSFPKGARITGTIGELNRNKNQIALIEQAKDDPNMYVAIVGDGENRLCLRQAIEKYGLQARVKIIGFMWANGVLRGFDVFSLPSLKEGLPYVILEARVANLPIIANRVGGVREALEKPLSEFGLDKMISQTIALY
jgi:glycosyltransferase involved in cell wall biosynthesis